MNKVLTAGFACLTLVSALFAVTPPLTPDTKFGKIPGTATIYEIVEASGYSDPRKRDKIDHRVYEPSNEHWTWTTSDPKCPDEFLEMANAYGAPKPRYSVDATGSGHWGGAILYYPGGSLAYKCFARGGSATDTSVTFDFMAPDGRSVAFSATAKRPSATDTTPIEAKSNERLITSSEQTWGAPRILPKYLHEVSFDSSYPEEAERYYQTMDEPFSQCSARRVGNICERNFDWNKDESAEFIVNISAGEGRFASLGVATLGTNLTEEIVNSGRWHPYFKAIPGRTVDGINENGVFCEVNVVPTNGAPWETRSEGRDINSAGGVRWVLDHATSAAEAATNLAQRVYIAPNMKAKGYSVHYAICDKYGTYVVEDGNVVVWTPDVPAVLTNFRVNFGQNPDLYGAGYERYTILSDLNNSITNVWYSNAYRLDSRGGFPWPTEFAGEVDSYGHIPFNDVGRLQIWAKKYVRPYLPAKRADGVWWQTLHTSIYDLTTKTLKIAVQEKDDWYVFALKTYGNGGGSGGYDLRVINGSLHLFKDGECAYKSCDEIWGDVCCTNSRFCAAVKDATDFPVIPEEGTRNPYVEYGSLGASIAAIVAAIAALRKQKANKSIYDEATESLSVDTFVDAVQET